MDKLTPQDVYLIRNPNDDFQRTDEFTIQDKAGNVIHYLEKHSDLFVHTKTQLRDILENLFDAGILYGRTGLPPDKEEYIDSLLNEET